MPPIDFLLIPQLRQTAPLWARNPLVYTRPITTNIENAVSKPARDIVEGFLRTPPQARILRLLDSKNEINFIERKLYETLFPLIIASEFEPKDFEQLYQLEKHIEGKDKKEKWKNLITDIKKVLSDEVREYPSHSKFIVVCNMLNDGWFADEGLYLYRNQGSTNDALEEFNALSPAHLQDKLHYIVNGRPVTTYFIHSMKAKIQGLNAHNYSSIGYVTCNLDQAQAEANIVLGKGLTTLVNFEDRQDKISKMLQAEYRNPVGFLFANTSDAILSDLCTIGTISQIEKHFGKQRIGLDGDFYEAFFDTQLNTNSKLKKICEYIVSQDPAEYAKEAKIRLGYILFTTAITLQKGSLSQDPKITLKELLLRSSSPFSPELLAQVFTTYLLADELRGKIRINKDPLFSHNFTEIDPNKLIEYIEKLADLPSEDLTNAFRNVAKRELRHVLNSSDIVLVKN